MSQASHQHVQEFLDKLDEIRAVFVLGRRSLPFLEDTIQFVEDITVLLEEVNATIQTRTGHMRQATDRLRSVSEATEVATSEILDHTDEVLDKLDALTADIDRSESKFEEIAAADERLVTLLHDELGEEHEALLAEVEQIVERKRALRGTWATQLNDSREALSAIRTKMNQIVMSLQVQDITEQQLTSVNHLIETVRTRIDALLDDLGTGEAADADIPAREPPPTTSFDGDARYDRSPERQEQADEVVNSAGEPDRADASAPDASPPSRSAPASQEDIDEMFEDHQPDAESPAPNDSPSNDSPSNDGLPDDDPSDNGPSDDDPQADRGEPASPEDIDALFR